MSAADRDRTDPPVEDRPGVEDPVHESEGQTATSPPASAPSGAPATTERDWTPWLDGHPRRLKRGKHYTGDPKALVKNARQFAEALGRAAVASRDGQGKYEYVWIQFVDAEVELGRPCPVCAGTALAKVQKQFLRCESCGSVLVVAEDQEVEAGSYALPPPAPEKEIPPQPNDPGEPAPDPRTSELGDILETRVLSSAGAELETAPAEEPLVLEITVLTHRPDLTATVGCALLVTPSEKKGRVRALASTMDRGRHLVDAGVHRFRAHVPAHLLSRFEYTVAAGAKLDDPADGSHAQLVDPESASISVTLETPLGETPGILHPSIPWSVHAVEGSPGPTGHPRTEASSSGPTVQTHG